MIAGSKPSDPSPLSPVNDEDFPFKVVVDQPLQTQHNTRQAPRQPAHRRGEEERNDTSKNASRERVKYKKNAITPFCWYSRLPPPTQLTRHLKSLPPSTMCACSYHLEFLLPVPQNVLRHQHQARPQERPLPRLFRRRRRRRPAAGGGGRVLRLRA